MKRVQTGRQNRAIRKKTDDVSQKIIRKQEYILVGCVLPAL